MLSAEQNGKHAAVEKMRRLLSPLSPEPTGVSPVLHPLPGVRVVLFDIYGTLLVSASGDIGIRGSHADGKAALDAMRKAGWEALDSKAGTQAEAVLKECILRKHEVLRKQGVDYPEVDILKIWTNVLSVLVDRALIRGDISGDRVAQLAVEYECRTNPVWPMPGLTDLLAAIRAKGMGLGIVSNSQFYTPLLFDVFLGEPVEALGFDTKLCSWSYQSGCAKPSIRLFQPVADVLGRERGLAPDQVLYVGNDMLNDIRPARELGWRTALFAGDRRSLRLRKDRPEMAGIEPDVVVTELRQLIGLFDDR